MIMRGNRGKAPLALLLSICMAIQLLFVGQVKPAAAAPVNLVANPGFEDTMDNIPAHWLAIGNGWNDSIRASTAAKRSGNYGVAIETNIANNPWVAIPVPVEEGATYEITSWFKAIGASGDVGYKVEFFKGIDRTDANWIYGYPYYAESSLNEPIFRKFAIEVEAPAEAKYMYVYLRLYGTGTVYFDDVSVIKSKGKPQIIVDSEHRYYYSDITQGNIDLDITPEDGVFTGKTVDIRIVDEATEDVLFSQTGIGAAATVTVPFDTSIMALQQPYRIKAELKEGQNGLIESTEQTIYRWARPSTVPDNGPILVDGQPFFPVIAYHVGPEDYPYLQAIGVNTVQGTNTTDADTLESELDAAHANGLKMLVTLYNGMKVKENAQMTEAFVTRFKNHPAVLGYMVMDEPSTNGIPNSDLIDAYKLIRSIDPAHPTYMVEEDWKAYRYTGHATDILVTDVYPIREGSAALPLKSVGEHVRKAVASVGDSKPVWTVLQTFKYSNSFFTTLPTEDQLRNMAYQAILSGAKGLAYYAIHDPGWDLFDSDFYPIMVKFKTELAFIRSLVIEGTKTDAYLDNDSNVQWAIYSKGDEQYAIAINTTKEAQTAAIPLAYQGNEIELLYGDLHEQAGSWTQQLAVNLKPEQTLVYRIKPFVAGVNEASAELGGSQMLIADSEWQDGVQGLIAHLQQLKSDLQSQPVNTGSAMHSAAGALGDIADLQAWIDEASDVQLEGKEEALNAVLDQAAAALMPIMQAAARLDLQLSAAPLLAGDELELDVDIQNVGSQEMKNVQLRIELPEEMDISPIEQNIGNIQSGGSVDRQLNPLLPDDVQPGVYAVKAKIHFQYEGIDVRVPVERSFTVQSLLTAKLTPGYIDITGAGTYNFSVELQNGSGQQLDVNLQSQAVSGIAVNLASSVTLAGNEKRTVQGSITIPENMTQGEYSVTIEALAAGVSYAILPLYIYANTNPVFNGGFERNVATTTTPEGWDKWAGDWDKSVAHSGVASIKLKPNEADPWNVVNTDQNHLIPISPGYRYKLTGWVKTAATAGEVTLGIRQIDVAGDSILYNWEKAEKTGDWEKIEVVFEAEATAKNAAVYFKIDQDVNAPAWVDDLELSRVTEPINPVFNPGFEKKAGEANRPDGWQLNNGTWDSAEAHGGKYAARLNPDAQDGWNVINTDEPQAIPVTPGKTYELTGWVKNSATTGSVALGVREVKADGGSVKYTWEEADPDSDWTKLYVLFTADQETATIWAYFKMDQAANAPAWLDDLELREVTNPVFNPGFEKKAAGANRPDGWQLYHGTWDSTVAHGGKYAARLDPNSGDDDIVVNTDVPKSISIEPDREYVLSGWVKNSATTGWVALGVREVKADGGSVQYDWKEAAPGSDWTKLYVVFTPQQETKTIQVYFKMDHIADAPAWLDDLDLREVVTALEANLSTSSIDADHAGTYPFAVELTNDSNIPVTVDLPRNVPEGLAVTLDEQVTLAAGETRTVQGTVGVSASTADAAYNVKIVAKIGSVSYATLPLAVNVHMTAIEADLTPGSIEVSQAGTTYPFAVELTNNSGSNFPVTVDLLQDVPDGLTLTLDEQVTLAAGETKTVQGTVEVSASTADDEYSVTIEAKVGSVSYAALPLAVNVHVLKIERIELSGLTSPMTVGAKANSVVTAVYNYGSPVEVTVSAEYDSSNPEVATVSEAGEVTAVSAGSTVITATYGGHTADFNLTVASLPDTNQNTGITTGTTTPEPETDVVTVGQDQVKPDNNGNVVLTLPEGKKSLAIPVEVLKLLADTGLEVAGGAVGITIPKETIQAYLAQLGGEGSVTFRLDRLSDTDAVKLLGKLDKPGNVQLQSAGDTIDVRASLVGKDGNSTAAVLSNQRMALKLKIAPGVDPRLVGIYLIHDDGTLEFIEGKRNGDRMEAEITSPGKYTLLVFDKHYMDVKEGHWAADSIRVLTARHIVNGVTETDFAPQREITRAEFAALLVRALNLKAGGTPAGFADVADSQWFARDVAAAKEAGLINGTNHGNFAPNQTITREEMAVMLVRAWELISGNRKHAGNIAPVGDVGQASAWAQASIQYALEQDLLKGRADGRFDPKKSTSRAESAQAIYNLLQLKDEL